MVVQYCLLATLFLMIVFEYRMVMAMTSDTQVDVAVEDSTAPHPPIKMQPRAPKVESKHRGALPVKAPDIAKIGVERNKEGPLQHGPSNLCVHPKGGGMDVSENNQVILFEGCFGEKRINFVWTDAGELMHALSKKCLVPAREVRNGVPLVLSSNCAKSKFELSDDGDVRHVPSNMCLHVEGGMRSPSPGTSIVLFDRCGLERNQFLLVTQEPINVGKKLGVPKIVAPSERPKRVAVSILITKDPGPKSGFVDSAATLVQSVMRAKSRYHIELVAIVSKEVQKCRYALERMGYRILEKELPVTPEEIRNPQIAREIVTDGCCGIWELLKLHAWKLTEYDRVLQVDSDIMFHRNFDELFEYDTTLVWTHGALGGSERLNGGFLVVRPNPAHFDEMVEVIKSGDFRNGRGWRGKCCWVYGGRTIQGIVPYYYLYDKTEDHYEVDRCKYNNMVEIDRCKTWRFSNVSSNHFTVCQKPWHCAHTSNQLCNAFTNAWWERSVEVEKALGLQARRRCRGGYQAIDWNSVPEDVVLYKPNH